MKQIWRSLQLFVTVLLTLLFLVWAAIGLMLNHADRLGLNALSLTGQTLLDHYRIGQFEVDASYLLGRRLISQIDNTVYVDTRPVARLVRPLMGGIVLDDIMVLASDDELLVLSAQGEFMERLGAAAMVPPEIQNIGMAYGEPVLQTRSGMWRGNFLLDDWEKLDLAGVSWSQPHPMPASDYEQFRLYFAGEGVTLETLLEDIYRGRFGIVLGVWLADLLLLLITVLAITALWQWWLRRYQQ